VISWLLNSLHIHRSRRLAKKKHRLEVALRAAGCSKAMALKVVSQYFKDLKA
jgi:hypothetical protein